GGATIVRLRPGGIGPGEHAAEKLAEPSAELRDARREPRRDLVAPGRRGDLADRAEPGRRQEEVRRDWDVARDRDPVLAGAGLRGRLTCARAAALEAEGAAGILEASRRVEAHLAEDEARRAAVALEDVSGHVVERSRILGAQIERDGPALVPDV